MGAVMERVDAVVIGAGIAGASVAYFLARAGMKQILVLDRTGTAAGASGRSSGVVAWNNPLVGAHPGTAALFKAAADFYGNWTEEIGGEPAVTPVGCLDLVAASGRAALERSVATMQAAGHETQIIERAAIEALVRDWNLSDVAVASSSPSSGFIEPRRVTTALMQRAQDLGARLYQLADVTRIRTWDGKAVGVDSARGPIDAPVVVLAGGAWTASLARLAGVSLPIRPLRHQVLVLKPPPGVRTPFPNCLDYQNGIYFRTSDDGHVVAGNCAVIADDPHAPPPDPDRFDPSPATWYEHWILSRLARRIPAMRDATVVWGGAGVFAVSPDEFPVLGPVDPVGGLYCLADTGGYGMTCSPGLGRALAETIVHGRTFTDITPFRPSRFAEGRPLA